MKSTNSRASFDSVRIKLIRAEKHLDEVLRVSRAYAEGECTIAMEKDFDRKLVVQRVRITPSEAPDISAIAGDFFGNIRSALDYIVWQLVISSPPNVPGKSNQFPITTDPDAFADQIARQRLRGVPEKAAALIESLQPYKGRNNPLGILNRLVNVDKHQTLNVVTVVADNTELISQSGHFGLTLGGEELRDGAIFGEIGMPFEMISKIPGFERRFAQMKMHGKCSLFVAFDDPSAEELEEFRVDRTLQEILKFVRDTVVPTFEPFLDGAAN